MKNPIEIEIDRIIWQGGLDHEWDEQGQCACGQNECAPIDDADSAVCEIKLRHILAEFAMFVQGVKA